MQFLPALDDALATIEYIGSLCQVGTALIAAGIGVMTFRYTKRQSALALINQNNSLANLVNTTIIQSEAARETLGKLHDFVVGCPDDAVLFMYLNYVHNTYRMHQIGAVTRQVWLDTLGSCIAMIGRLRRDQVTRLLSRGYEAGFQHAVLARYDAQGTRVEADTEVLTTLRPRPRNAPAALAMAG
jgi:hypothetical protein